MQGVRQTLQGIPSSGHNRLGVARVMIPTNVNRDEFIKNCLNGSYVCLRDPFAGYIVCEDAVVPTSLISDIKFPDEGKDNGSLVSYKVIDKRLIHIVDSVIPSRDSGSPIDKQGERLIEGNESSVYLGTSEISISSSGTAAKLLLQAIGEQALVQLVSGKEIKISARVRDDNTIAEIAFTDDGQWHILRHRDKRNAEPALLGDTSLKEIESILDEIKEIADQTSNMTIASPFGPLGPPINKPQFVLISQKVSAIKRGISKILSKNLKID